MWFVMTDGPKFSHPRASAALPTFTPSEGVWIFPWIQGHRMSEKLTRRTLDAWLKSESKVDGCSAANGEGRPVLGHVHIARHAEYTADGPLPLLTTSTWELRSDVQQARSTAWPAQVDRGLPCAQIVDLVDLRHVAAGDGAVARSGRCSSRGGEQRPGGAVDVRAAPMPDAVSRYRKRATPVGLPFTFGLRESRRGGIRHGDGNHGDGNGENHGPRKPDRRQKVTAHKTKDPTNSMARGRDTDR